MVLTDTTLDVFSADAGYLCADGRTDRAANNIGLPKFPQIVEFFGSGICSLLDVHMYSFQLGEYHRSSQRRLLTNDCGT